MNAPQVVSPEEWESARQQLLVKEKEHTRARDALAAERRRMPMVAVGKDYTFEGPDGPASLRDLFDGRRQLIVYRFFFDPDMELPRGGLRGLLVLRGPGEPSRPPSRPRHQLRGRVRRATGAHRAIQDADGLGVPVVHHDRRLLRGLRRGRMARNERLLARREDRIFRTYFVARRGDEAMGSTWSFLDITPYGRQEEWEDSPEGYPQTAPYQWWDYHDKYESAA